jgi:hypothetical protein
MTLPGDVSTTGFPRPWLSRTDATSKFCAAANPAASMVIPSVLDATNG